MWAGLLAVSCLLAGCGAGPIATGSTGGGEVLAGRVQGGNQPVQGASISLYSAGTGGPGVGATNLLKTAVTTDQNGNFSLTGDYTCPAGAQVYLVSRGGNPGLGTPTNNQAAVLVAALGPCSALTPSTFIFVNEVTTVAAAWALAPFLHAGAIAGSSATNTAGLANAFSVAAELANTQTGSTPGTALPAGATMETTKLNTLADALVPCVNSDGTTACTGLFAAAKVNGVLPGNTFDAAVNIVSHPGTNVGGVFGAVPAQVPFQPVLTQAPNDWTMSIVHTGGGLYEPSALGVDSAGNVWVANYAGGNATEISPAGMMQSFADPNLYESYGLAIDGLNNVWITNEEGDRANSGNGSVTKLSASGSVVAGSPFAGGGIYYPYAVAVDTNNEVWVADYGRSRASLLANDGSSLAGQNGFDQLANLPFPSAVAVDKNHNAWFAITGGAAMVTPAGVSTAYPCCNAPEGIALDQSGNVWLADSQASDLVELDASGNLAQTLHGVSGLNRPESVAVDGAGSVWVTNYGGNTLSVFTAGSATLASTAISPAAGFGLDTRLGQPFSVAIDAAGGVWVANFDLDTVTQFVGAASPVRTPLQGPPVLP